MVARQLQRLRSAAEFDDDLPIEHDHFAVDSYHFDRRLQHHHYAGPGRVYDDGHHIHVYLHEYQHP